jgi:hypothetical protein
MRDMHDSLLLSTLIVLVSGVVWFALMIWTQKAMGRYGEAVLTDEPAEIQMKLRRRWRTIRILQWISIGILVWAFLRPSL